MARRGTRTAVRSAITGRFVRKSAAKRSPRTTITQVIRMGGRRGTGARKKK